jgi:hypothetical protein
MTFERWVRGNDAIAGRAAERLFSYQVTVSHRPLRPASGHDVLYLAFDPIRDDAPLSVSGQHLATADEVVKLVLKLILLGVDLALMVRLRP